MSLFATLYNKMVLWQYKRLADYLENIDPHEVQSEGDRRTLKIFKKAQQTISAYKKIYQVKNLNTENIKSIEDFKKNVPIVDKESLFQGFALKDLCEKGALNKIRLFYSSSGSSGIFSFGAETWDAGKNSALELEFVLNEIIHIFDRRTLIINCLPMGVKIHTRTVPLIESGTRTDVAWALLKKVQNEFDQFVILGEQLFLKKLVEEGFDAEVPWNKLKVHLVTGAEYVSESFRRYIGSMLGHDLNSAEKGSFFINYGLSEVSNIIGRESLETIRLRRLANANPKFRESLYGDGVNICANIFQYHPYQTYLETVDGNRGSLVMTTMNPARIFPLIRYNTKDEAKILSYDQMREIVFQFDPTIPMPKQKLPFVLVWGKYKPLVTTKGHRVFPEQIKEALYENFDIAKMITGNFRLINQGDQPCLLIQLKKNIKPTNFNTGLLNDLQNKATSVDLLITAHKFEDYPYGFEQNFEKKASYLD